MFGFLKDKIKGAIKNVTDRFDKEAEIVETKLPEESKIKEKPQEKVKETKKEVAKEKPKEEPKVKEKPRDLVK